MRVDTYWIGLTAVVITGVVALGFGLALAGCITKANADGSITTQMDVTAVRAALDAAQQLYDLYQERHPADTDSDRADDLRDDIAFWESVLSDLLDLQNATGGKATVAVPTAALPVGVTE